MILVDSSVWIDHLRRADPKLATLLDRGRVLAHPFVIGELALGSLCQRDTFIGTMLDLPKATVADQGEVLAFIEIQTLFGCGRCRWSMRCRSAAGKRAPMAASTA